MDRSTIQKALEIGRLLQRDNGNEIPQPVEALQNTLLGRIRTAYTTGFRTIPGDNDFFWERLLVLCYDSIKDPQLKSTIDAIILDPNISVLEKFAQSIRLSKGYASRVHDIHMGTISTTH